MGVLRVGEGTDQNTMYLVKQGYFTSLKVTILRINIEYFEVSVRRGYPKHLILSSLKRSLEILYSIKKL